MNRKLNVGYIGWLFHDATAFCAPYAVCDVDANRLAFLKSCAEGRPHIQDAEDAWRTHAVCLAAEHSALNGFGKEAVDYSL